MQMFLTQLQGYNSMFKLLSSHYERTKSDDIGLLLDMMCFLEDGSTSDSAVWYNWLKVINESKKPTKKEAFEGMIKFLKIYRGFALSDDVDKIIEKLRSAKNCDDTTIPIVKQWNLFLKEALSEPEGTREYLQFSEPKTGSLVWIQGFNTVYLFLNMYEKQNKSKDIARLVNGMLFLSKKGNVDPEVADTWSTAIDNKLIITKQEAFDGTIRFLEIYQKRFNSDDIAHLIKTLHSEKNCDDVTVPLVQQWNFCLEKALNESVGTREYVK